MSKIDEILEDEKLFREAATSTVAHMRMAIAEAPPRLVDALPHLSYVFADMEAYCIKVEECLAGPLDTAQLKIIPGYYLKVLEFLLGECLESASVASIFTKSQSAAALMRKSL